MKILDIAREQLGITEKSENIVKYWEIYPAYQGQPWCDCFVSWCAMKAYGEEGADRALCGGLFSFWTPTSAQNFKNSGQWHKGRDVEPGDQIFFQQRGTICHTGLVEYVEDGIIHTIEGNSGDAVRRRSYEVGDSYIAGYGRPVYPDAKRPAEEKTTPVPTGIRKEVCRYGRVTADALAVRQWAGVEYPQLKSCPSLFYGDEIGVCSKIFDESGATWYYIKTQVGTWGFCHSGYVELI